MSWTEVPLGATASRPFATAEDQYLRFSVALAKMFDGVERVDRLLDGRRVGLRPSPRGVKLYRPKTRTNRALVAAGQIIRELNLMDGQRLNLVGIEDGVFVLEVE